MAHSINELLVADMTLLWPSSGDDQRKEGPMSVADIVPYTWEEDSCGDHSPIPPARGGPSFLKMLRTIDGNDQQKQQQRSLSDCDVTAARNQVNNVLGWTAQTQQQQEHQEQLRSKLNNGDSSDWYSYCKSIADQKFEWISYTPGTDLYSKSVATVLQAKPIPEVNEAEDLLLPCERSVKGLFIHPEILTGFRYVVRQADSQVPMFDGLALQLTCIGRGYGKRLTFESESKISNDNYFYCDSHPAGYAFRLVALEQGDQFTLRDSTDTPIGFVVISRIENQSEISQKIRHNKQVEKRMSVTFECNVDCFYSSFPTHCSVVAQAVIVRERHNGTAKLQKIVRCKIDGEDLGYTMVPGIDETERESLVCGEEVGDIPASYITKGFLPHELPVIGTFVHPNIMIGAKYKVRSLDTNRYLFGGAALTLQAIGKGYGKRLTFEGESLIHNDNYFYSDTNELGWGFTMEAFSVGDQFRLIDTDCDEDVGRAEVFRADAPQQQHAGRGDTPTRAVVDVQLTCHFWLQESLGFKGYSECTTTVAGIATLNKSSSGIAASMTGLSFGFQLDALSHRSIKMVRV